MPHLVWRKTPVTARADTRTGESATRCPAHLQPPQPRLIQRRQPSGISFEVADLLLAQAWAAYYGVRLHIRLDHATARTDYEEVMEFNTGRKTLSGLIMWRTGHAVYAKPVLGKKRRFESVAHALERLLPEAPLQTTDIVATAWPTD